MCARFVAWAVVAGALGAPTGASELTKLYKRVQSSVVVIETTSKDVDVAMPGQPVTVGGLGSGVLISDDGKVLTAAHVVQTANYIEVEFQDGERIPARVLASEPAADLALIQLKTLPQDAYVAELADSDDVEVGEQVFVIGCRTSLEVQTNNFFRSFGCSRLTPHRLFLVNP